MNEKLLQYIWNYKILDSFEFKDLQGNTIEIIDFGKWNVNSGADFLLAKIKVNGVILVGNVEIHLKSSDWDVHRHSENPNFENVILHLVYEHDKNIAFLEQKNIPTIELKTYISKSTLDFYQGIYHKGKFISCEDLVKPFHLPFHFAEEILLKKLDDKAEQIESDLAEFKNDYEAVLFHYVAYAFGLKINAKIFKDLVQNIDFKTVRKLSQNATHLEALFFGYADWLNDEKDEQTKIWKREFDFITKKFGLNEVRFRPKFLRLRPPNFPTIRLSQLAMLYHREQNLFSKVINAKKIEELRSVFNDIQATDYWNTHFNLGKISKQNKPKKLSQSFIDLVLLNAILPIKYAYHRHQKENINDEILELYRQIKPENNSIIKNYKALNIPIRNALESQAYIYHHQNFCKEKKCLDCGIGFRILNS